MEPINKISNNLIHHTPIPGKEQGVKNGSFQETLKSYVYQVDKQLKESGQKTVEFVVGQRHDLHEIMIASEKAGLHLKLLLTIRNKLLEAYQEIMRMQF